MIKQQSGLSPTGLNLKYMMAMTDDSKQAANTAVSWHRTNWKTQNTEIAPQQICIGLIFIHMSQYLKYCDFFFNQKKMLE